MLPTLSSHQRQVVEIAAKERLGGKDHVTGKRLRQELRDYHQSPMEPITSCVPAFLERFGLEPEDRYLVTLAGLLNVRGRKSHRRIQAIVEALRTKFEEDPDFRQYTTQQLQESSPLLAKISPTHIHALVSTARLMKGGSGDPSSTSFSFRTPSDIESVVDCSPSDLVARTSEAETDPSTEEPASTSPPKVRAFISYSHEDKLVAGNVKDALEAVGILAFLAHEDIGISEEWERKILMELERMQLFVPLISKSFTRSSWAPQEVGYSIARPEVLIIPIQLDETTPIGFISRQQGKQISDYTDVAELIAKPLLEHFTHEVMPGFISRLEKSGGFRVAEARMEPLVPYFEAFTKEEANTFVQASCGNSQVWNAATCRDSYLPRLLEMQGSLIDDVLANELREKLELASQ